MAENENNAALHDIDDLLPGDSHVTHSANPVQLQQSFGSWTLASSMQFT
jgi:hypothetical protein